jgi:hypothetical protein
MEAFYYAARGNLRRLLQLHPSWTRAQLAQATGMSLSWVDKWKRRLKSASPTDEQVLHGLSRAPHHPHPRLDERVVDRLLEMRDEPPERLGRTPGPKALLYYLPRDESLQQAGLRLPRSTRTIHRLLRENGRIAKPLPRLSDPIERPKPMEHWQLDFKDASSVPADPDGKHQPVVETLNIIDMGTSVNIASHVRADFTAETALRPSQRPLPTMDAPSLSPWIGIPGFGWQSARQRLPCCLHPLLSLIRGCGGGLRPAPSPTEWVRGEIQQKLPAGVPRDPSTHNLLRGLRGDRDLCRALQLAAAASRDRVWQSSSTRSVSRLAQFAQGS